MITLAYFGYCLLSQEPEAAFQSALALGWILTHISVGVVAIAMFFTFVFALLLHKEEEKCKLFFTLFFTILFQSIFYVPATYIGLMLLQKYGMSNNVTLTIGSLLFLSSTISGFFKGSSSSKKS